MCGIPILSTAERPSANATGATKAQLASSNGVPKVSDHRRSSFRTAVGNWLSHSARSGVLWQFSASRHGTFNGTILILRRALYNNVYRSLCAVTITIGTARDWAATWSYSRTGTADRPFLSSQPRGADSSNTKTPA